MSIELRPLGALCNLSCVYCYQNSERAARSVPSRYDIPAIKRAVEKLGGPFTLFGGEPLLMPIEDLDDLLEWGFSRWGGSGLQTNGVLIRDAHVRMFQRYNVRVGISLDGPDRLNSARAGGSEAETEMWTEVTEASIRNLCHAGIPPGLIITLHRLNASGEALPELLRWLREMESLGIGRVNLHLLEIDGRAAERLALNAEENVSALLSLAELEKTLDTMRLDLFSDIRAQLMAEDEGTACVWGACDPYTTGAVESIGPFGGRGRCGRVNKEGIDFLKSDREGFERSIALYHTPQEHGGCRGCRFFLFCKGYCPGTALGGDWRNRTVYCEVWKAVFARVEEDLIHEGLAPVSADARLASELEEAVLAAWTAGTNPTLSELLRSRREAARGLPQST